MTLSLLFQSTYILRRPRVANLAYIIKIATMFIKQPLKTQKKLKKWEIMYQNAIYNCFFFLYKKKWWFTVKKWWSQQSSRGLSHKLYTFWIFFRCAKSHYIRICVTDFMEGDLCHPTPLSHSCVSTQKITSLIRLIIVL